MKVTSLRGFATLLLAVAVPAFGGAGHKCEMETQACLNEMAGHMKDRGWAGFELDKSESGALVVKAVHPGTPAEAAGIQKGDVLLALNGIRFDDEKNKEALYAVKKTMKPGVEAKYTVSRGGKDKQVAIKLARPSDEVIAGWVGSHMMEHARTDIAKN